MRVSSVVPAGYQDAWVVEYLASRFTYLPAGTWQALAESGRVWCNDQPCPPATPVRQGDVVACDLPDFTRPGVNFDYTLLYEDAWLLAVNKPANLRVHSRGRWTKANLIYHLRHEHQPPYPAARLVNRLDADSSGVVLVALDGPTLRHLQQQFENGGVMKQYWGVVHGVPAPAGGVIDLPLGPVTGGLVPHRQGVAGAPGVTSVKAAVTRYETVQVTGAYTLLRLEPLSGRTHQLRVHLAAIGHPLLGDALYQMGDADYLAWCEGTRPGQDDPWLTRQALHCCQTRFQHPQTGAQVTVFAPLPPDLAALWTQLGLPSDQPPAQVMEVMTDQAIEQPPLPPPPGTSQTCP